MIKTTLEKLLGRELVLTDGIDKADIKACEQRLGITIPQPLRELYLCAGNCVDFLTSFNQFYTLDEIGVEDNKLVFAEENQGVVYWSVSLDEELMVYQQPNHETVWYSEELGLSKFLELLFYYQCAQAYYQDCGYVCIDDGDLEVLLAEEWTKVVDHNDLHIYNKDNVLIWWLYSAGSSYDVFFNAPSKEIYDLYEKRYDLSEL